MTGDFGFHWIDWLVVAGYLFLSTLVGHAMRGKQASIRDFFLGGKSLPWPAVSGSIIATEISGVTFIGVPGMLFAMNGDFTYLQWAIGSILARVLVGVYFVRVYYEREIYSPYDYMGLRLGNHAKTLTTALFTVGSILAQSVRVLVAAIPLEIATGMPLEICVLAIGLFAIGWTLMGGMRTVIWTDVMQFALFLLGGVLALVILISGIEGGFAGMWQTATEFGRTKLLDTSLQKDLEFTLWVAIFAVPFQNLGMFGTDQLMAQRMFCCRDAAAATKAIIYSSIGQLITILMLLVGAALFVHHQQTGFSNQEMVMIMDVVDREDAVAQQIALEASLENAQFVTSQEGQHAKIPIPKKPDYIFPIWIVEALPIGLSGLILAGVFAAAISSLDSILAALSQTTLSLIHHPERGKSSVSQRQLLCQSRVLVVIWGLILVAFTFVIEIARKNIPILPLAFGMTAYTVGPILAIFLCAMMGRGSMRGLFVGAGLSILMTMFVRMDIWVLVEAAGGSIAWLANLPTYEVVGESVKPVWSYVWMWPLSTGLTLLFGLLLPHQRAENR